MSDVGILNGPFATAMILLIVGGPGFPVGAIIGALAWRGHRIWGALIGGVLGFGLCLTGWLYFTDNL